MGVQENLTGYDHINCNPPVLIRTPKLTQFEPAQYWGGGPPGNSAVLYQFFFAFFLLFLAGSQKTEKSLAERQKTRDKVELNHRPIGLQPIALPLSYSPTL